MIDAKQGIGLLGCGAIGRGLALAVDRGTVGRAELVALFDQDSHNAQSLLQQLSSSPRVADSFEDFMAINGMALVVEAASQRAVRQHGAAIVSQGKHLLIMSTGALLDAALFSELATLTQQMECRIFVPSGAVGGIDAIRASRGELEEIILTTRKPPQSLVDTASTNGDTLKDIGSATVVFEGSAQEAVRRFPFNINVAATLSLAGLGPQRTRVRIIADPEAKGNIHEVYAAGKSGVMRFILENVPDPHNPMTSHLAVLSAIETLRSACEGGLRVGA
ncbi:MAG: aspartate dehydrogenase [Dehalococcoidia bacterium]|jgi:aspartate dehydrogenase|nr:aspartate dehydrogenase [Dehalococcoidia bacterium]